MNLGNTCLLTGFISKGFCIYQARCMAAILLWFNEQYFLKLNLYKLDILYTILGRIRRHIEFYYALVYGTTLYCTDYAIIQSTMPCNDIKWHTV